MIEFGVLGSIAMSALALWRSGRSKLLDRRTELRKECAGLRLALENLAETIPVAVDSRARISAMTGQAGALQQFREEAEADRTAVENLRSQVAGIEPISLFAGYNTLERKLVLAHEVGLRVKLLQEKYALAAEADQEVRREHRAVIERLVERSGITGKESPASMRPAARIMLCKGRSALSCFSRDTLKQWIHAIAFWLRCRPRQS